MALEPTTQAILWCCLILIVLITSSSLLGVSFDTVSPTEWGIIYDNNILHIEAGTTYVEGRYLVGLGRSFLVFPRTRVTVQFGDNLDNAAGGNIVCRTQDGMVIDLEVSFQYELMGEPENLVRLYQDFGGNHEYVYGIMLLQVAQDVSSQYRANEYFTQRETIQSQLQVALNTALNRVYARVPSLQLTNTTLNPAFSESIIQTQIALQDISQASYEQLVAVVYAASNVTYFTTLANVQIISANYSASSYLLQAQADADVLLYKTNQQIAAYTDLRQRLHLNSSSDLLAYSWLTALQETQVGKLWVGLDVPSRLHAI